MPVLPHVGDLFGRYRIDAQIGRGGMGVVYGATDTTIGRTVALKVVSVGLGDPSRAEEFRLRFEREAAVLARLDSPHVIAIYDYGTHDDCPYIATQYVGGGDLGDLLAARGPMPAPLALTVCAQVADALHDAHRVGVVHRDVKPTNVLLRDADAADLHAYLCDFGIARTATDGITQAGAVAGTWSYLSPECGRGAPGSPASDVYALGCLLWATLTGAPPYAGSDVEVAVGHQRAPIPQLGRRDALSQRVDEILRRCLAKDPADRYASADLARIDLLAAASLPDPGLRGPSAPSAPSTPPPAAPPSQRPTEQRTPDRRTAPARRRTATVVGAACLAVAVVAGGAYAATRLTGDPTPSADPTATSSSTTATPPSPDPTSPATPIEPTEPARVDQEGPVTGDLDGDGLGDLTIRWSSTLTTWRSTGTALVQQGKPVEQPASTPAGYATEVVGDFDGDDVADTVAVQVRLPQRELRLSGPLSGGGVARGTIAKEDATPFLTVTDLDGDGAEDLVIAYVVAADKAPIRFVAVRMVDGRPRPPRLLLEVPLAFQDSAFQVGDFDGDGLGDIAVVDHRAPGTGGADPQALTLWLGDGAGVRKGPQRTFPGEILTDYLAADLDGDEDLELVVVDLAGRSTVLRAVDVRAGRILAPRAIGALRSYGDYGDSVGITDLDGDGRDDVVVAARTAPRTIEITVAVSDGTRVVPRPAATWTDDFDDQTAYLAVSSRSSS